MEITFHHPIVSIRSKSKILPKHTEEGLHKDVNPRRWELLGVSLEFVIKTIKIKTNECANM